jgi:hypothetical protein
LNKLRIAIILLLIIPALIAGTHLYLRAATDEMCSELTSAQKYALADDKKEAARQVAAFTKSWQNSSQIMATFIRHSELDPVNISAARLKPLLSEEENGDFLAESAATVAQLRHIWESDRFTPDNIF